MLRPLESSADSLSLPPPPPHKSADRVTMNFAVTCTVAQTGAQDGRHSWSSFELNLDWQIIHCIYFCSSSSTFLLVSSSVDFPSSSLNHRQSTILTSHLTFASLNSAAPTEDTLTDWLTDCLLACPFPRSGVAWKVVCPPLLSHRPRSPLRWNLISRPAVLTQLRKATARVLLFSIFFHPQQRTTDWTHTVATKYDAL